MAELKTVDDLNLNFRFWPIVIIEPIFPQAGFEKSGFHPMAAMEQLRPIQ